MLTMLTETYLVRFLSQIQRSVNGAYGAQGTNGKVRNEDKIEGSGEELRGGRLHEVTNCIYL